MHLFVTCPRGVTGCVVEIYVCSWAPLRKSAQRERVTKVLIVQAGLFVVVGDVYVLNSPHGVIYFSDDFFK